MPGQIGQIGHHLNDQAGIQCNLNGFPPNSTTQDSTKQAYNAISMDFHPI